MKIQVDQIHTPGVYVDRHHRRPSICGSGVSRLVCSAPRLPADGVDPGRCLRAAQPANCAAVRT